MRPVSAAEMAEIDKIAQEEYGISQFLLMENAGRAVAEAILDDLHTLNLEKIAIFCGKGNNGGDGFVTARYLKEKHPKELVVFTLYDGQMKDGAARDNYLLAEKMGVKIQTIETFLSLAEKRNNFTIGVDAVFGTGFKGELSARYKDIFSSINSANMKMYAVDIPSGLDATTGDADDDSIKANKTITFELPKKGFFLYKGPLFSGEIEIKDIGFPKSLIMRYQ
ncbi:MAG: NAD(P)H-hydrate epimerase [Candidatus Omnitrophota bacterium]